MARSQSPILKARNEDIVRAVRHGMDITSLADYYGVSRQRIHQIVIKGLGQGILRYRDSVGLSVKTRAICRMCGMPYGQEIRKSGLCANCHHNTIYTVRTCKECGKQFEIRKKLLQHQQGTYCSGVCKNVALGRILTPLGINNFRKIHADYGAVKYMTFRPLLNGLAVGQAIIFPDHGHNAGDNCKVAAAFYIADYKSLGKKVSVHHLPVDDLGRRPLKVVRVA